MARLITFVHVADESGVGHAFGPGDEVPGWAAKRITNPAAWDSLDFQPELELEPELEPDHEPEPATGPDLETEPETETVTELEADPELEPETSSESDGGPGLDLVAEPAPDPVPATPKRRGRSAKAATEN
ncbi:hypothetical protein [Rhodococcus globerulus]|uniref:hypothetical protein n=1 Tax=Rhodococcus globerulus TaxID=33008 RepID=UPI001C56DBCA|nr:hypothetical protein [Rhodococcus globerulus]QXW04013.1 hypothetical protein KYT97_08335 [Rhodococcus globerulus]